MKNKYYRSFYFANTEGEARQAVERLNRNASPYMRRNHPAAYTPWTSLDGSQTLFCVWYNVARY